MKVKEKGVIRPAISSAGGGGGGEGTATRRLTFLFQDSLPSCYLGRHIS